MEGQKRAKIDVCHAIAVREQERLVFPRPVAQTLQSPARLSVEARIDQVHAPRQALPVVHAGLSGREIDRQVVVDGREIEEVSPDHLLGPTRH